ncbi:hypothetical protein T492DRAFT_1139224 [Pavlovales sp. CCMP2436]|nr:hypothetical protein T492DRAFT_1139224 [Pavlovales sp. CCMP2436]
MRAVVFAQGFAVALLGSTAGAEQVGVTAVGLQGIYDLGAGSVDEVASWLDGISFGELKKSFAKHQVDGPALRDITEDELRELGVKKVGARKLFGRLLCEALPDCDRPDLTAPEDEVNVSGFSVAEVGDWLVQEGFGDAKKAFAVQGVDGHALLDLNEDELKNELGVNRLGPRRRFARTLCTVMPGCKNPRRADDVASWSTGEVSVRIVAWTRLASVASILRSTYRRRRPTSRRASRRRARPRAPWTFPRLCRRRSAGRPRLRRPSKNRRVFQS